MSTDVLRHHPDPRAVRRQPAIPHGVLGMLIFVTSEVMFFAGLLSAYLIIKASVRGGAWPPPGQPRLPVGETAVNTAFLILSGILLILAERANRTEGQGKRVRPLMVGAMLLGALFVALQGVEWVGLLREGLTLTSSSHGSFFYMIVGTHALHAVAAILGLGYVLVRAFTGTMRHAQLQTALVFWLFVVGVWPILYWQVYL